MKTRCFILSIFLALFAFCTAELSAQGSCPPEPDCFGDTWIGPQSTTFVVLGPAGNCTITVWYCYRFACNSYYDMYITGVSVPPECFGVLTNQQLLDMAMNAVWKANPWRADIPDCPQSLPVWRVFSAGCYASVPPGGCNPGGGGDPPGGSNPGGGETAMTINPCLETAQCFALYRICRTSSGEIQKTLVSSFPAGQCTGTVGNCPCFHWCPE